jgi:ankyrin repeat protein
MCLNFFFHGNGTTLQKSPLGMFRSLLHQLYTQTLEARIIILRAFEEKKGYGDAGKEWEWRLNELRDLFSDALIAVTGFAEVTVLVDALDEAVDQALDEEGPTVAEELLDYFHLLNGRVVAQGGRVHICISCRHYPNVAVGNGLQIYVERENGGDLETFVREQLQSHVSDWDKEPLDARSALVVALVDKAAGQFLWARIRVPEVARSLDDGVHAFEEVHKLIEAESNKLSALYEKIITSKIEVSLRAQALQFMQWVCLAERPLSLEELRFAMACDEDRINHPHQDHCEESEGFINSDNRMGRLAKSLSGGLAEVRNYDHGSRVQLIHQTVKEFLWSGGFALLFMQFAPAPTLGLSNDEMIGNSENRISRSCINYLRFGALTKASSYWEQGDERAFCFVDYAAKYWTLHAERAERRGVTQENIVELFETAPKAFEGWIRIYEAIDLYSAKRPDPSSRLIHVASSANLQSTVRYLLKRGVAVDEKGYRDNTALHCAAKSGHEQLVRLLLDENAEIEARNMEGYTALERAARAGHEGVVQLLLQRGAEINKVGHSGTALQAAAMEGNPKLVKFLIKNGADVNVQGGCWGNALQAAAMQGNEAVVKLLIEEGADVNIDGGYFGSALQAIASADEDCDVLARFLLDQGADVNAQGGKYGTALQAAARYNKLGFARLLLDRNADVNASGGEYGGALQAAAYGGSGDLVHLLIEAGADANADGGFYGSVLQAAAVRGGDKVVRILLEHGANVNARSGWFGSPLQAAAWACNEVVVRLLLSLGADVNWECGAWGHALQAAVIGNASESLIILLLDHGAHVTARGWALQDAVYWGRTGLFYLLLDRGAKVNNPVYDSVVGPGRYGSILQMAAASVTADVTIVRTLLDRGAKVNAQGGFYGNALQAAVDCGHQEIVELLLQRGADIDIQEGTFQGLLDAAKGKKSITKLLLDQDMKLRPPGGPSCHIEETYQVAPD